MRKMAEKKGGESSKTNGRRRDVMMAETGGKEMECRGEEKEAKKNESETRSTILLSPHHRANPG